MDLRISETARQIGVTSATIRNWIKHFGDFLSSTAIQTTRKRFTARDVAMLKEINRLSREGYTWQQIPDHLTAAPQIIEPFEDPQPAPTEHQVNAIQSLEFGEFFERLLSQERDHHQREIERLEKSMNETIQVLKAEIDHLKKPWWKRL